MKLSHRDFRPAKRSRFVGLPPHRRPALRILLLGAFGILVYYKFDDFLASRAIKALKNPSALLRSAAEAVGWQRPAKAETSTPANQVLVDGGTSPPPHAGQGIVGWL